MRFAVVLFGAVMICGAADKITGSQAKDYVGKTATVCGKVASTRYLDTGRKLTFLNFEKAYPEHTFTAIIEGTNRAKFGTPEKDYDQKNICVTGEIKNYQGKPEIELTDPKQVELQK